MVMSSTIIGEWYLTLMATVLESVSRLMPVWPVGWPARSKGCSSGISSPRLPVTSDLLTAWFASWSASPEGWCSSLYSAEQMPSRAVSRAKGGDKVVSSWATLTWSGANATPQAFHRQENSGTYKDNKNQACWPSLVAFHQQMTHQVELDLWSLSEWPAQ